MSLPALLLILPRAGGVLAVLLVPAPAGMLLLVASAAPSMAEHCGCCRHRLRCVGVPLNGCVHRGRWCSRGQPEATDGDGSITWGCIAIGEHWNKCLRSLKELNLLELGLLRSVSSETHPHAHMFAADSFGFSRVSSLHAAVVSRCRALVSLPEGPFAVQA